MNELALPETNQLYLVIGGSPAAGRLLHLAARLALRGPLLLLDCGNRANPLPLARELRHLTPDPVAALGNTGAAGARAFNAYQVTALIAAAAQRPRHCPSLVFDLPAAFYDESLGYSEGRRLLEQTLARLVQMSRRAPVVVSAKPPPADFPQRKPFLELLCRAADQIWREADPALSTPKQLSFFQQE